MPVRVKINTKQTIKDLKVFRKSQIPFITATSINNTMAKTGKHLTRMLTFYFDRPTPFTKRMWVTPRGRFRGKYANKRQFRPVAIMRAAPIQEKYINKPTYGGHDPRVHAAPAKGGRLNQYGNIPSGATKRGNTFDIKTATGHTIRMRRNGKKVTPIASWAQNRTYRKQYPYEAQSRRFVNRNWTREFRKVYNGVLRKEGFPR